MNEINNGYYEPTFYPSWVPTPSAPPLEEMDEYQSTTTVPSWVTVPTAPPEEKIIDISKKVDDVQKSNIQQKTTKRSRRARQAAQKKAKAARRTEAVAQPRVQSHIQPQSETSYLYAKRTVVSTSKTLPTNLINSAYLLPPPPPPSLFNQAYTLPPSLFNATPISYSRVVYAPPQQDSSSVGTANKVAMGVFALSLLIAPEGTIVLSAFALPLVISAILLNKLLG